MCKIFILFALFVISLVRVLNSWGNQNHLSPQYSGSLQEFPVILDNELWNISHVKLMNCEKFTLVREVKFTILYNTCNCTVSEETSPKATGMLPKEMVFNFSCWIQLRPKKNICAFRVSRPTLTFLVGTCRTYFSIPKKTQLWSSLRFKLSA